MMNEISVLVMLGICSITDMKNKRICVWWPLCFSIEGMFIQLFVWKQPMVEFLQSMFPGAALLLLSLLSRGNIGAGDGMLLVVVGIFLGAACTVQIVSYAVFFVFGYALYLYLIKKKSRNYEIPFIPFVFMAFVTEKLVDVLLYKKTV